MSKIHINNIGAHHCHCLAYRGLAWCQRIPGTSVEL